MVEDVTQSGTISGQVKWFDTTKGFGFVVDDEGGPDVLLHANVLRGFGRTSVVEGTRMVLEVQATARGLQAVAVTSIDTSGVDEAAAARGTGEMPDLAGLPMVAARVKWFDKGKGFGFANVFGDPEDVFVHVDVLRRGGFAELQPGEAVAMKVVEGPRGKMAAEVRAWDGT